MIEIYNYCERFNVRLPNDTNVYQKLDHDFDKSVNTFLVKFNDNILVEYRYDITHKSVDNVFHSKKEDSENVENYFMKYGIAVFVQFFLNPSYRDLNHFKLKNPELYNNVIVQNNCFELKNSFNMAIMNELGILAGRIYSLYMPIVMSPSP